VLVDTVPAGLECQDVERDQDSTLLVAGAALQSDVLVVPQPAAGRRRAQRASMRFIRASTSSRAATASGSATSCPTVVERDRERGIAVAVTGPAARGRAVPSVGDGSCERDRGRRTFTPREVGRVRLRRSPARSLLTSPTEGGNA